MEFPEPKELRCGVSEIMTEKSVSWNSVKTTVTRSRETQETEGTMVCRDSRGKRERENQELLFAMERNPCQYVGIFCEFFQFCRSSSL